MGGPFPKGLAACQLLKIVNISGNNGFEVQDEDECPSDDNLLYMGESLTELVNFLLDSDD